MFQKIIIHVNLREGVLESDINAALTETLSLFGGDVLEIEDYQESCYSEDDLSK